MDVDESFAEYVAARWSMLYRLAVLLVDEDAADALTQAALVRAYVSWPEVQEAPSADERVKEFLGRTAMAGPADRLRATSAAGGELWSHFSALPTRQRAVLVLRSYEYLSDPEIARMLGCKADVVEADAATALASLDGMTDLPHELTRRAEEADVPLPPIRELLTRGHEERGRRTRRTLGRSAAIAAVVVAGVALAGVVQDHTSGGPDPARPTPSAPPVPQSLTMLPDGDPVTTPFTEGRTLFVRSGIGTDLPTDPVSLTVAGSWVYVALTSGTLVRVDTTTLRKETVAEHVQGEVVSDDAGRYVAWRQGGPRSSVVTIEPVDSEAPSSLRFPGKPNCCSNPFLIAGVTPSGDVIASLPAQSRAWVWSAGDPNYWRSASRLAEISGLGNGMVKRATPGEIEVEYPPSHFAVGVLEDANLLVRDEINARQADFGDPQDVRVVYTDGAGEVHVRERDSRVEGDNPRDVRLRLPALEEGFASIRWEDADHVLLDVFDDSLSDGALVRCDVVSGACAIAVRFDGWHLVAH